MLKLRVYLSPRKITQSIHTLCLSMLFTYSPHATCTCISVYYSHTPFMLHVSQYTIHLLPSCYRYLSILLTYSPHAHVSQYTTHILPSCSCISVYYSFTSPIMLHVHVSQYTVPVLPKVPCYTHTLTPSHPHTLLTSPVGVTSLVPDDGTEIKGVREDVRLRPRIADVPE